MKAVEYLLEKQESIGVIFESVWLPDSSYEHSMEHQACNHLLSREYSPNSKVAPPCTQACSKV
jgi:hypothetical protein